MTAVIILGGQQYFVKNGDEIYVEKLDYNVDDIFIVNNVLMCNNVIGDPYIKSASVECQLIKHGLNPKLKIIKHIPQKHHTKTQGHRQKYSKVKINKILLK